MSTRVKRGETPLYLAARNAELLKISLSHHAEVNTKDIVREINNILSKCNLMILIIILRWE